MAWQGKSRGTPLGYWFFIFFMRHLGLRFTYSFLRFVALYFHLFDGKSNRAIMQFLSRVNGSSGPKARLARYRTYYTFGQVLIDRVAILSGMKDHFTFNSEGHGHISRMVDEGTGGMLISAHVGNWEIAGNLLQLREGVINVVMYDAEKEQVQRQIDSTTGGRRFNIIGIKEDMSHMFEIADALMINREIVCMHGDRYMSGMRTLKCDFLGREAYFPYGPFAIAAKFAGPKSFVYGMRVGDRSYSFHATDPIVGKCRPEDVLKAYVAELERMARLYPQQWFNFYDFWALPADVQEQRPAARPKADKMVPA